MTAPREDASALVARVRALQTWPFLSHGQVADLMRCAVKLCTLVEQGERDRRRLDWLAQKLEHVRWDDVFPDLRPREADGEAVEKYISAETFWSHIDAAILRDAAMQPNDSAARTGQEG